MTTRDDRARQAEIDAARAREIEEERLAEVERAAQMEEHRLKLAASIASGSLPDIGKHIRGRGITSRIVREYVREVMLPPALKRLHDIGHGIAKFDTAVASGPGGAAILQLEAPPNVQRQALSDIVAIGVPRLRGGIDGDGSPINGVIVLGMLGTDETPGLDAARERAARHRVEEHGPSPPALGPGGYIPPPGHETVVYEEDLSGAQSQPSPDDPPPTTMPAMTKAQQAAARRRAALKKH